MTDLDPIPPPPHVLAERSTRNIRRASIQVAVGVAALGVLVGVRLNANDTADLTTSNDPGRRLGLAGTVISPARDRPDFSLTTTDGRPFRFAEETKGRLTLLFFGYTSCPDVCPIHLATLTGALSAAGVPRALVVFVGVDPPRDTPERMREFLDQWDTDYVGLVGTPQEIAAAQDSAGVPVAVSEPVNDEGEYLVGHSTQILVYTSDDKAHVMYPFGVRRQDWVQDLPRLEQIDWSRVDE